MSTKTHLQHNDTVEVISGEDVGRRGRVLRVDSRARRVVVEGVNIKTKHRSHGPRQQQTATQLQSGRIEMPAPIDISNVMLVCPHCERRTRVRRRRDSDRPGARACRRCHEIIDEI